MGLRFRRTVSLAPGLRVNISKSGLSTSVGVRGAHVTLGHGRVRSTVGIPGTGLSYTTVSTGGSNRRGRNEGSLFYFIAATIWLIQYLPLILLYAALMYAVYLSVQGWHPVFIVLMLLSLTWSFFIHVRRLAELVSQDAATCIGAVFYGTGMVGLKVAHLPDVDWIWTFILTVVCAVIGAWSYRSCHAAMLRMPGAASIAPGSGEHMARAAKIDYVPIEAPESLTQQTETPIAPPINAKDVADFQTMVIAGLCIAGWDNVKAEKAQGVVAAEYREKKVVILCCSATTHVGDEAVHRIYEYRCKGGADYAAIASNVIYTSSELRLALGTRVLLIQPDQLTLLEELIFGTTALEPQQKFRVEIE